MKNLRYESDDLRFMGTREVACPACKTGRGEPCRTMSGRRVGRAVSYRHVERVYAWYRLRIRQGDSYLKASGWTVAKTYRMQKEHREAREASC